MSREIGSRPFGVILTVRSAVFICGLTAVMVPWRIVPGREGGISEKKKGRKSV